MSIIISIVIPIFNAQLYLKDCLDSIVLENLDDIEIILVDDGSYDNSKNIAIEYANSYSCIRFFHQNNQGVFAARNKGLLYATGEYIWFVDGDDLVANKTVPFLINTVQQYPANIILFKYKTFFDQSVL